MNDQPDDRMLTVAEVAALTGIAASDFRVRVSRGTAPQPDDPDEGRAPNRRQPRWRASTIKEWDETRQREAGRPPSITEVQMLDYACRGMSLAAVAADAGVSEVTVRRLCNRYRIVLPAGSTAHGGVATPRGTAE